MHEAGKEGKPWISGLFGYRVTPQSGSIASPLQLIAPEMHQTHQELIKRQRNNSNPDRTYQELLPGISVWVQHRQNATWEPAIVVNQSVPNSYWIRQENGVQAHQINVKNKIYSNRW